MSYQKKLTMDSGYFTNEMVNIILHPSWELEAFTPDYHNIRDSIDRVVHTMIPEEMRALPLQIVILIEYNKRNWESCTFKEILYTDFVEEEEEEEEEEDWKVWRVWEKRMIDKIISNIHRYIDIDNYNDNSKNVKIFLRKLK